MPAVIENPHSSRLWRMPSYQHARTIRHVKFDWTDFCQDGTPWRNALLSFLPALVYQGTTCGAW